jgi:hypothetical protein
MKAQELRIGNYVNQVIESFERLKNKKVIQFDEVNWYRIGECIEYIDWFEPIPLTEEWLVKFGFIKIDNRLESIYRLGILEYATSCKTIDIEVPYNDGIATHTTDIKYVHQLQNLYFALTNEELTINKDELPTL